MEQHTRRKQIIILSAGMFFALALAVAHYLSPVSRALAAGRDVKVVVLGEKRSMLFIYHPGSRTVNAVRLPAAAERGLSAYQRAYDIMTMVSGGEPGEQSAPLYIETRAADIGAVDQFLNNWRAKPALIYTLARYLSGVKKSGATNLSAHDMLIVTLEFMRLNSSNFVKEDFDVSGRVQFREPVQPAQARPEVRPETEIFRVEVLNASGRKDLAVMVTRYLRKKGFDVINFGTYSRVEQQTRIINCSGDLVPARRVREALELDGLEIYSKFDKLAIAQARVIIGMDFDGSKRGIR